ncbi:Maf [Pseudooceanicola batsensis HTCC2597]|uniref:Nucleoside triphosphate pyrophosphatase n=1 Tax=Pseudooceanicola batsensis (strain ATCC BAA-863 / DSM 15984 / KCTC 12145 / HTCC2597) TaxID=252305 RepID=A3TXU4_PSEBH|nr:Maf family protein [Pseudooceanicola batsensis]EAQ02978.1 Maf [Pseudooceanicola batsensis HTCC2597]
MSDVILASKSSIRAQLLRNAGVPVRVTSAAVDEDMIKRSLQAEGHRPRDVADALAEAKAHRVGQKDPGSFTIGCDQVLDLDGALLSKAETPEEAAEHLERLSDRTHRLYSAAVIFHEARPIWRHIGEARLTMRRLSAGYIASYLDRNWPEVGSSVGVYQIEAEGSRLFSRIDGDYFSILGLPLLPLLTFLTDRGVIET